MAEIVFFDNKFRKGNSASELKIAPPNLLTHIALIGNFPPRRCGIATFTADTRDALMSLNPHLVVDVYALDDGQG